MSLPSTMEDGDQPSERFAFTLERDRGCIAVVENTLRYVPGLALETADTGYILNLGKIQLKGPGSELLDDPYIQEAYLGFK